MPKSVVAIVLCITVSVASGLKRTHDARSSKAPEPLFLQVNKIGSTADLHAFTAVPPRTGTVTIANWNPNSTSTNSKAGNQYSFGDALRLQWQRIFHARALYKWIAVVGFGILAWCTLIREILTESQNSYAKSREPCWDMAKFCLMCLVWINHAGLPGAMYYDGWFMPAFYFLCGLVITPENQAFSTPVALRVLRDNLVNSLFLTELIYFLQGGCHKWYAAWFLPALGIYRLGVPLCFVFTKRAGEISGSILLVVAAFILPYLLEFWAINFPFPACLPGLHFLGCHDALHCQDHSMRIMRNWIFYVLGFLVDERWLASQLETRIVTCTAIAVVVMLFFATLCGFVQTSNIVVPWSRSYLTYGWWLGWPVYVYDTVARQFYTMLLLACLAFLIRIGTCHKYLGVIPQVLAHLGRRTLHAFLISAFFYWVWAPTVLPEDLFVPGVPLWVQYTAVVLATSVACCPLTEWCVGFLTSPQWIVDAGAKVFSMVNTAGVKVLSVVDTAQLR